MLEIIKMREIVIEKVMRTSGNSPSLDSPSLIDQIDVVLRDISFEAGRLADDGKEPAGLDAWIERIRQQFWRRQLEVVPTRFTVRMAAPGFGSGEMKVVITESAVELRGSNGRVIRHIFLPAQIDPRTVYAVFDDGYLQLIGTRFDPEENGSAEYQNASLRATAPRSPARAMAAGQSS